MKRTLQIASLLLAAFTLSACDTLTDLVKTPPVDYSGNYADMNVDYGTVCGAPRSGEVHLGIDTAVADDASLHTITATAVIYDAGANGATITHAAQWSVDGDAKSLSSGALADFGSVTLKKNADRFTGTVALHNVECVTPAEDPSKPDTITFERITVPFAATAN